MEKTTIFSKSAKGLREAIGKTKILSRSQRNLLKEIDGKATFGELIGRLSRDWSVQAALQGTQVGVMFQPRRSHPCRSPF